MDISKTLKYYRKLNKMTQQQISDAIGKERTSYTKYELGVAQPPLDVLEQLATLFNIPLSVLLSNDLTLSSDNNLSALTAKNYDEQEILTIFRQLNDEEKKEFLSKLKQEFLKK